MLEEMLELLAEAKEQGNAFSVIHSFDGVDGGEMIVVINPILIDFYSLLVYNTFDSNGKSESGMNIINYQIVDYVDDEESEEE